VPVYAYGAGAELFDGFYDNTDVFCQALQNLRHRIKTAGQKEIAFRLVPEGLFLVRPESRRQ
jgi:hypothetical protein